MAGKVSGLRGFDELIDVLAQLPGRVQRQAVLPALVAGGNVFRDEARARAPNGPGQPHPKYGELRRKIVVLRRSRAQGLRVTVHTGSAFWAQWIEFGRLAFTVKKKKVLRGRDGRFYGRKVAAAPARPFFRPAWDASKARVVDAFAERLGQNIAREAEKLAGRLR